MKTLPAKERRCAFQPLNLPCTLSITKSNSWFFVAASMGILSTSQGLELSEDLNKSIVHPFFPSRHWVRNRPVTCRCLPFAYRAHRSYQGLLLYWCSFFLLAFPKRIKPSAKNRKEKPSPPLDVFTESHNFESHLSFFINLRTSMSIMNI